MVIVDSVCFSFSSPPFVSSHCFVMIHHGRRSIQLLKLRHLSVSVKPEKQNASSFSSSFSSSASAVDSLGLTTKLAESISRKVRSEGKGNPDSVLNLFKSYGFTDSQIASIIKGYPVLLREDAVISIGAKLKFLQSRGASTSELTEILSKVPKILGMRWDKAISIYYDFVKEIIEADESSRYVKLCQSLPEGSPQENKFRNVLVLRELGVPRKILFSLLFSNHSHVCGKERFEESLKKVVEMGFDPKTSKFVEALCVVYKSSEKTLEDKVNVYKSLGFDVDDVWEMFKSHPMSLALSEKNILNSVDTFLGLGFSRDEFVIMVKRFPQCIKYSEESVKKKTEFVVKKMYWSLKAVALFPQVLSYSMEKRILPRCNVINALMSKELLQGSELPPLGSVLACTNDVFLERYVKKHDDIELVAELMSIFTGKDRVSPSEQR